MISRESFERRYVYNTEKQKENSLEIKTGKYYAFPLPSIVTALSVNR